MLRGDLPSVTVAEEGERRLPTLPVPPRRSKPPPLLLLPFLSPLLLLPLPPPLLLLLLLSKSLSAYRCRTGVEASEEGERGGGGGDEEERGVVGVVVEVRLVEPLVLLLADSGSSALLDTCTKPLPSLPVHSTSTSCPTLSSSATLYSLRCATSEMCSSA